MQQVIFRLLGPPEILYKEQPIKIPRRRARALLYYLVSTQTPQPRERLLALLWGDVDEESARHTFKTLLAEVRALLRGFDAELEWIISDDDLLRLNPLAPLWLDTEIFEKDAAIVSRNLSRTIALYRGDFLDGFFLRDAPGFETWVRSTRDHFRHLYLTTLRRLAELYEADHQFEQAITCLEKVLAIDPLMEEAYTSLMHLYWKMGQRVEALREYERLCEVLAQELAIKPSLSTRSLYEQIARSSEHTPLNDLSETAVPLSGTNAHEGTSPLPGVQPIARSDLPPFVGRTAEMAWLREHLAGETAPARLLWLTGEPGIGKTRLVREALAGLAPAWLVLWGTCQEGERKHAYHAVVEALRSGLTHENLESIVLPDTWLFQLTRLTPELFPNRVRNVAHEMIQPLTVARALEALFQQLASPQRPLLLVLDDLHWADEETLALLGYLTRAERCNNLTLLCTSCPVFEQGRLAPLWRESARCRQLAELRLSPLSGADLAQFVSGSRAASGRGTAVWSVESSLLTEWCYQRSEGNPLLAQAWLAEVRGGVPLSSLPVPTSVVALVQTVLAFLSREALSLLTAAAFLDAPCDLLAAASSLRMDSSSCLLAVTELLQAGLLVEASEAPGCYYFVHESTREVVQVRARPIQRAFLPWVTQSNEL